jgi:hypothetical protein
VSDQALVAANHLGAQVLLSAPSPLLLRALRCEGLTVKISVR